MDGEIITQVVELQCSKEREYIVVSLRKFYHLCSK